MIKIDTIATKPFEGQKPGTSGLRKQVVVFKQEHYTENFIQCILEAGLGNQLKGSTIVVGGDGRYLCDTTAAKIVQMAAANGVAKVLVGRDGFMSTPAVSCVIRNEQRVNGGIILTASHNPGGPKGDFGIKFNCDNGGPASDTVTDAIFEATKRIQQYYICKELKVDLTTIGTHTFNIDTHGPFSVRVIDPVEDYAKLMKSIFDFDVLRRLFKEGINGKPLRVLVDSMHGATGPYVEQILVHDLGLSKDDCRRTKTKDDFGGGHPDPNLTYAADLVKEMHKGEHDLGAAFDGDGDRNMILGANAFFVTPSDSLAVLAANLECIPYFKRTGVKGYARSMPTAGAVDRVAQATGKDVYETPTGWKYFGNLLDAGKISLCGEESFGTGSDHIREKDGLWALLAWLSVVAHHKQSVEAIVVDHWRKYGRNVFTRYDYENCDAQSANLMMNYLEQTAPALIGHTVNGCTIQLVDNFAYTDPVDGSRAEKQGIRLLMTDGSRCVFRLSGTGSSGATVRMYVDTYVNAADRLLLPAKELLQPLISCALNVSKLEQFTGRKAPTVIT